MLRKWMAGGIVGMFALVGLYYASGFDDGNIGMKGVFEYMVIGCLFGAFAYAVSRVLCSPPRA